MSDVIEHDANRFNAMRVESKGLNVLMLRRIKKPMKNFSGQTCRWELEYRWLSQMDEALCCVLGTEFNFFPDDEVDPKISLFEQFNLF